ncbi:MFS transporter [Sphingomonas colocasiae]|uniref:MFS transporter n=1 Tax=Sphingomonas colocasiae TaxID=1848973 RepID=A0ABS7PSI4_9SPHN|nr:MFS transporter [Sphingomonas colocasiae]MBY8824304.1 MFS transporter [Sphingomonas colocasiae]
MADQGASAPASAAAEPGMLRLAPQAWYIVGLLCFMYVFSFVDRLILGLLAPAIGQDLGITDTQLGLLIGTSFAIVYSIAGVPVAHFLDRANRKYILVAGILLWSAATLASGFAWNFATLAVLRAGVALGESVLTPAAVSLIADLFPRERRVLPMSIYAMAAALMGIGGLIIGAASLQLAELYSDALGMEPWRLVLILVGVLPLLLGILFALTTREPKRDQFETASQGAVEAADTREFLAYLNRNRGFFIPFYLGAALIVLYLFAIMTWTPTLLIRGHGVAATDAGYLFGFVGMATGFAGAIAWPRLVILSGRRGWREPIILCTAISCIVGAPFMIIAPSLGDMTLFLAGMGAAVFAGTGITALMPLAVQAYGPPRLRARLMALVMLSQSLIGYGAGPPLVAALAKRWPGDPGAFGTAITICGLVTVPAAALCYLLARRALIRQPLY